MFASADMVLLPTEQSGRRIPLLIYSDATKDSGVFLDVDATQDLGFPESKYRDYFLGSL
jgi:hypothetical protein